MNYGRGRGLGRALGVGVTLGAGVGVAVGVGVGLGATSTIAYAYERSAHFFPGFLNGIECSRSSFRQCRFGGIRNRAVACSGRHRLK